MVVARGVGQLTPTAVCIVAQQEVLDVMGLSLYGRGGVLHNEVCVDVV